MAIAQTVSDAVNRLEHDLGVDGAELTVLFCVTVLALVALLLLLNKFAKRKSLRVAHAGRYRGPDPYARSFHILRTPSVEQPHDPMTMGPARDASNPRFRPEVVLPEVPDPFFPTLGQTRAATASEAASARPSGDLLTDYGPGRAINWTGAEQDVPEQDVIVKPDSSDPPESLRPDAGQIDSDSTFSGGSSPIAGWYVDPEGAPGSLRYWDGHAWTQRRPA